MRSFRSLPVGGRDSMSAAAVRGALARRLFWLIAAALGAPGVEGCTQPCDPGPYYRDYCLEPSEIAAGGAGGGGGQSTGGAGGTGGSTDGMCPAPSAAQPAIEEAAGFSVEGIVGEATQEGTKCCYTVYWYNSCGAGRPFVVGEGARAAEQVRGDAGWRSASPARPETATLDTDARERLSRAWARDGLFEHASVASFGRFAIDLLAVGAPADLVEEAHRAAIDEVRHARLCLGLASAYAGVDIAPGPFPAGATLEVTSDLAILSARCASEGAIGETLAALVAAEQLAQATDPAVREVLSVIVEEEARHAELAWRTIAWALRRGGPEVRGAIARVFEALRGGAESPLSCEGDPESPSDLERAHGRIARADRESAIARALQEVVLPAARLLLRDPSEAEKGTLATA